MTPLDAALLVGVGAIASGLNAVAGGGSLISFPTLTVVIGLPEKIANAFRSGRTGDGLVSVLERSAVVV